MTPQEKRTFVRKYYSHLKGGIPVETASKEQIHMVYMRLINYQSVVVVPQKRTSPIILIDGVPYIRLESGELMLLPDSDYEDGE